MEFCPTCANMLLFDGSRFLFACQTCPYIARIPRGVEIKKKQLLVGKKPGPVVKKDDIPTTQPETDIACPKCDHKKAYVKTFQFCSDIDPEDFYRCVKCELVWH